MMTDLSKSIEQLENDIWPAVNFSTPLVEKCYLYRKIPVNELSIEQLRLLIGQHIGLPFIMPKAFYILSNNILAEGDLYEGDLLNAVLSVDNKFWNSNPEWLTAFRVIVKQKHGEIESKNTDNAHKHLLKSINRFLT